MITITGTLFDILGCLAFVAIYITVLITWQEHKKEVYKIQREKQEKEELHHFWLKNIGLEETGYYFNRYGLETLTIWSLWKKNVLGMEWK